MITHCITEILTILDHTITTVPYYCKFITNVCFFFVSVFSFVLLLFSLGYFLLFVPFLFVIPFAPLGPSFCSFVSDLVSGEDNAQAFIASSSWTRLRVIYHTIIREQYITVNGLASRRMFLCIWLLLKRP